MSGPEIGEVLTIAEVAARLRVKPATVYSWCARGLIPHHRPSARGAIRFEWTEVMTWWRTSRFDRIPAEREPPGEEKPKGEAAQ